MLSYLYSFFSYIFGGKSGYENDDEEKENFLAEQIFNLELANETNADFDKSISSFDIPRNTVCFQKTGIITYIEENHYVLIDGMLYFDITGSSLNINMNDKVLYLAYKDQHDSYVVVRILENYGTSWGMEENTEENSFDIIEHTVVGEVNYRDGRSVYIKDNDFKFNLDDVEGTFIPIKGDWLEMICRVQWDENKPSDITGAQVLQVMSFKPLRTKVKTGVITEWNHERGSCDRQIYITKEVVQNGAILQLGQKVMVEIVESNQGTYTWRALKLIPLDKPAEKEVLPDDPEDEVSTKLEKEKKLYVTNPIIFEELNLNQTAQISLDIVNNSDNVYTINKWVVLCKKSDSQIDIKPFLSAPKNLPPGSTMTFKVTCQPKFLGNTKECLIILFRGFKIKRFIEINIVDDMIFNKNMTPVSNNRITEYEKIENMKKIRSDKGNYIPGQKLLRPSNFIAAKLGAFPIPSKIWTAILGSSDNVLTSDYNKSLERIETSLPCLTQELDINNYVDKWHTLLYMEEVQVNIYMRSYDIPKVFLIRCQEYLGVEITGLAERRPSMIKGDRVIVKDIWDNNSPKYEGYVHNIKGDLVLMKFNPRFHETYSGSDVSIEFQLNRGTYRRAHQAIHSTLSSLGSDILFPNRITTRTFQLSPDLLNTISWFNEDLNTSQKTAVSNILLGECRPMPYCIYGPPGTGKTVTVIETILQILTLFPDSRLLIATPSNSAANLITEILIEYRNKNGFSASIVRLIAHYLLESDGIPDVIKPFCATLDISRENTSQSNYNISKDGMNLNCQTSFIGRHRVTIGTCYTLGTLAQMGLPRGHFTHIIVDEAGQATEPEIMIPLTFIDKKNGQIVLAGDPMQLGPVVMSNYCVEFGMNESYLCRMLECFPYQRDYDAFEDGFDNRLVTKLIDNYRSVEQILTLPSIMFYDSSLVPKINKNEAWILQIIQVMSQVFPSINTTNGGIFVYGIRGVNTRATDSPSWYNPQEAAMVALTTCKLVKNNVSPDDIGIITPYIAQIKYLRLLFTSMGLVQPKIGSVEEFQGQERPIILISTVRSTESHLQEDIKHTLGFVKNPKRLNVALTRAQVAVVLFCNPHLLCRDPLWCKVITHSVKDDKYLGCDLPNIIENDNSAVI